MASGVPASRSRVRGRRTALTGLLAGALVAGGVVVATTVAGSASATTSTTAYQDVITLQTGSRNIVTQYGSTAGGVVDTDALSASGCRLSTNNGSVMTFGGGPGRVGLRQGSIGIIDSGSGESCGQVNAPSEKLVLTLPGKAATSAVLDIEVQKDAVVTATMTLGAGPAVVRTLRSGQATVGATGDFFSCRPGSTSSAPNSGVTDNCRWVIDDVLFDRIEFTALQGQFSLEGGGDGAVPVNPIAGNPQEPTGSAWPTTMTYFAMADGINCTDNVTLVGSGMVPTVTIDRVTDLDGASCTVIPYNLSGGNGEFTFNKPVGAANAQFYIDVAWKAVPGGDVKKTTIDYLYGGGEVELDWCPEVVFGANGGPLTVLQAAGLPDQETSSGSTAKEFACILSSASTAPSGGYITINQRIYLLGDPRMRG